MISQVVFIVSLVLWNCFFRESFFNAISHSRLERRSKVYEILWKDQWHWSLLNWLSTQSLRKTIFIFSASHVHVAAAFARTEKFLVSLLEWKELKSKCSSWLDVRAEAGLGLGALWGWAAVLLQKQFLHIGYSIANSEFSVISRSIKLL